ncbi:Periplasmic binding protein [anaerobic digester metagenome]
MKTKILLLLLMISAVICCTSGEEVIIGEPIVVQIMGNANMDQYVDDQDIAFIQEIISGSKEKTKLADANNDGSIDQEDITQIEKILDRTATELFYLDANEEVSKVRHPLNTAIVVYDNAGEIIRILGAQDKIIGTDNMIVALPTYFPEFSKLPSIGNRKDMNVEAVLDIGPEAVIVPKLSNIGPEFKEKITNNGIDYVMLRMWESHTAVPSLMTLGYILDETENANRYISYQEKILNEIKSRVATIPEEKRKRVFMDRPGDTTVAKGSGYSEAIEFVGGINIAKDISKDTGTQLPEVDAEWVVKENPDVIIGLSWEGGYETDDINTLKKRYDEIIAKPGFSSMDAVKNNQVWVTTYIDLLGPGYHIGLVKLAKMLYPELFADMDVKQLQNEYLTNWQHINYDLENHGVFQYPKN